MDLTSASDAGSEPTRGPVRPLDSAAQLWAQLDARTMSRVEAIVGVYEQLHATLDAEGKVTEQTHELERELLGNELFWYHRDLPAVIYTASGEVVRLLPSSEPDWQRLEIPNVNLQTDEWKIVIEDDAAVLNPFDYLAGPDYTRAAQTHVDYSDAITRQVQPSNKSVDQFAWKIRRTVEVSQNVKGSEGTPFQPKLMVVAELREAFPELANQPHVLLSQERILSAEELAFIEMKRICLTASDHQYLMDLMRPWLATRFMENRTLLSDAEPVTVLVPVEGAEDRVIGYITADSHPRLLAILSTEGAISLPVGH